MTLGQQEKADGLIQYVNIEGIQHPWARPTITTAEIRNLGNLGFDLPLVYEDADGSERTLNESEDVKIRPGHRIGRAAKYRRGSRRELREKNC
jgi:hypothetical protein